MGSVLGLSFDYHDSAAALCVDGEVVAAVEQERLSRRKHDAGLPLEAIASVLAIAELAPDELDAVAFYEKPLNVVGRYLATRQRVGPSSLPGFVRTVPDLVGHNLMVGDRIQRGLRRIGRTSPIRVAYAEHHESHAAAAFYPSPFETAAILTVDGVGEWATATIGRGSGHRIALEEELRFPTSLGLLYSLMTVWCGFRANDGEYKLMGLAPYGTPRYADAMRELLDAHDSGAPQLQARRVGWWGRSPRRMRWLVDALDGPPAVPGSPSGAREADIAASIQVVTEEAVLGLAARASELTGERRLCLAGGVALNCVANARLLREGPFDELWVQPAAGDAGSAIGAALWHTHLDAPRTPRPDAMRGAALGPRFGSDEVGRRLDELGVPHRRLDDAERADEVARRLADGEVVGWFQGRVEFGPRALGHRSILADPRSPTIKEHLNLQTKGRESFRPFAPAVLDDRAGEWFDVDAPSPFMLLTAPVRADRMLEVADEPTDPYERARVPRSAIPACTHIDGSARVQTVGPDAHPAFHALLERFDARTGCPVLLNTSFNVADEPIVCTPDDALSSARRAGLDLLVIEDHLVEGDALQALGAPADAAPVPDAAPAPEVGAGAGDPPPAAWREVPRVAERPRRDRHGTAAKVGTALAAIAIGPLGPVVRTHAITIAPRPLAVAVIGLLALAAVAAIPVPRWLPRLLVAGAAGLLAAPFGGIAVGAWLAMGTVLAAWAALGRPPVPGLPDPGREALGPVVALALVATLRGRSLHATVLPLAFMVLASVAVIVISRHPGAAHRATRALAHGVRTVVAAVLLFPVWLLVVLLPWLLHRLFFVDPLRAPVGAAGTVRRVPSPAVPSRLWSREAALDRLPFWPRFRRKAIVPTVVVVAVVGLVWANLPAHRYDDSIPAAFADDAWFPEYRDVLRWYEYDGYDTLRFRRARDLESRYLNVSDGMRKTWAPPASSRTPVTLWMYGGSTTFGFGQRDEHTIASELARLAHADGIDLQVLNRGVAGDTHWLEAQRFAWDLSVQPHPDLTIFYDGANDLGAAVRLNAEGRADEPLPSDLAMEDLRKGLEKPRRIFERFDGINRPDSAHLVPDRSGSKVDMDAVGRAAIQRYERSRQLSRAVARQADVPVDWFWQPTLSTQQRIEGQPEPGPDGQEVNRAALAVLPKDVIDLTRSLDDAPSPVFYDDVHTNELGARMVAEAIYARIRPALREAAQEHGR
ncbi:MAG: carbamoyltransferase N-terminal domain-containing protein [Acidimicrobiales bacterium]